MSVPEFVKEIPMTMKGNSKTLALLVSATAAAVVISSFDVPDKPLVPAEEHAVVIERGHSWYENQGLPGRVQFGEDSNLANAIILQSFARVMLSNSVDIRPEITAAIDRHFWELL